MTTPKFINNPYKIFLPPIFFCYTLSIIVTILTKDYLVSIACFGISLMFPLLMFLLRKYAFKKILINEEGLSIFYRKKLLNKIKWEDIKAAKAIRHAKGGQIVFYDKEYKPKEKRNAINEIFIFGDADYITELYKYRDKIPVEIKDLNKLPKKIADKLKNDVKKDNF